MQAGFVPNDSVAYNSQETNPGPLDGPRGRSQHV